MKTIKKLIVIICAFGIFTSCTIDDATIEATTTEIKSTGDKGDDVGDPNDRNFDFIVNDSIQLNISSTGDKGDDTGNPDD